MGTYTATEDIYEDSFSIEISPENIATRILYAYKLDWANGSFLLNDVDNDATAATNLAKDYILEIELPWATDSTTADDVVEDLLDFRKTLQTKVTFDTSLRVLDDDLSAAITVDHFNGPTLTALKITELNFDLDTLRVTVVATSFP